MNRRHFFKSLATVAGATSVSPLIFIPKFEPVRWNRPVLTQQMLDEAVATVEDEAWLSVWGGHKLIGTWRWVNGEPEFTNESAIVSALQKAEVMKWKVKQPSGELKPQFGWNIT